MKNLAVAKAVLLSLAMALTGLTASAQSIEFETGPGIMGAPLTPAELAELNRFLDAHGDLATESAVISPREANSILMNALPQSTVPVEGYVQKAHGTHNKNKLAVCPACTSVPGSSNGHCKKYGKLFRCAKRF
jgi:hypothetical protein